MIFYSNFFKSIFLHRNSIRIILRSQKNITSTNPKLENVCLCIYTHLKIHDSISIKFVVADKFLAFIKCFCDITFFNAFEVVSAPEVLTSDLLTVAFSFLS